MIFYVELKRTEPRFFSHEVEADTAEAAIEAALLAAPGDPGGWSIITCEETTHRATDEPMTGAAEFDRTTS